MTRLCDGCGKASDGYEFTSGYEVYTRSFCSDCAQRLGILQECEYEAVEGGPHGIVMWVSVADTGEKYVKSAWLSRGSEAVYMEHIEEMTPCQAFAHLCDMVDQGLHHCSKCGAILKDKDIAGRHFAGVYCKECWTKYREDNSRKCRICGQPLFRCVC